MSAIHVAHVAIVVAPLSLLRYKHPPRFALDPVYIPAPLVFRWINRVDVKKSEILNEFLSIGIGKGWMWYNLNANSENYGIKIMNASSMLTMFLSIGGLRINPLQSNKSVIILYVYLH